MSDPIVGPEPRDRLTRLCKVMTDALEGDPEFEDGIHALVMLDDGDRGGIQTNGYDDMRDVLVDLMTHLDVLFRAAGMRMELVTIPDDVGDLDE